jgi:AraC family transcriptional regulator of adaptative response / DNA-3-methyladenine glycosylase II
MILDADICYRAVRSRDPRFDGRFFTGVLSTGIYCRPTCPARTPRRENVRFFACAAAAEAAGLRPCLRCRPETAPGTPAWSGSAATVSRALRLIEDGFLDRGGVDDLAGTLGVGARHLRRLFAEHLGASPHSVATTRRIHFARRLLDETSLPVTEIAFSAGFSSIRRFNAAFRNVFGRPPSQFRRSRSADPGAVLRLRLQRRRPYDVEAVLRFLADRAIPGVEQVGDRYRRTVEVSGDMGVIEILPNGDGAVDLAAPASLSRALPELVARTRRLFDLDADPQRVAAHLCRDPDLAPVVMRRPGLPLPGAWDGFEMLVRAIVGQQVSVAAARTLLGRIAREYGERLKAAGELHILFPRPERLARARLERLGIVSARARALRRAARAVAEGQLVLDLSATPEQLASALTALPGIGEWTAQMVAMRALGDPDAFPAADLGLLRGARAVLGTESSRELKSRAEAWRPWRAYAAAYLWDTKRTEVAR